MTTTEGLTELCPHCGDSNWPGHCPYLLGQCICGGIDCATCHGTGRVAHVHEFLSECCGWPEQDDYGFCNHPKCHEHTVFVCDCGEERTVTE